MKRLFWVTLGFVFLVLGLAVISALTAVGIHENVIVFLGLPLPLLMVGVGILILVSFAYKVFCDETGIKMSFVFRKEHVPWEYVDWYKNVGYRGKVEGQANVWVLLKYRSGGEGNALVRHALLLLRGEGPVVGWSAKGYTTELNKHIPSRSKN